MMSWNEMMKSAKQEITLLQVGDVKDKLGSDDDFALIDCREKDEVDKGRIPKSIFIPRGVLEMTVERHFPDRDKAIILYCAGGGRSAMAAHTLKQMGYNNVSSMEGGFGAWRQLELPVEG